jgi:hypothetical protein
VEQNQEQESTSDTSILQQAGKRKRHSRPKTACNQKKTG